MNLCALKKFGILFCIGILLVILIIVFRGLEYAKSFHIEEKFDFQKPQVQQSFKINRLLNCNEISSVKNNVGTIRERLNKLKEKDCRIEDIINNYEKYPEELLDKLSRDIDILDFVLKYQEMKENFYEDNIGEVTKGKIPLLLQWDERWGYVCYGDNILAINGCGPTAISMVIAGLTGNNSITPKHIADFAVSRGHYVKSVGTSWNIFTDLSEKFGVKSKQIPLNKDIIFNSLKNGQPIICSVKSGDFTIKSHIIVLTGIENDKIKINDPNSKKRSKILWDYDRIAPQIKGLWVFYV